MSVLTSNRFKLRCKHGKYIVDESLNKIECALCHKELNPIWVLGQMCNDENRYNQNIVHLKEVASKAQKKNRCKCEKCGEITRIQR